VSDRFKIPIRTSATFICTHSTVALLLWSAFSLSTVTASAQSIVSDFNADRVDDFAIGAPGAKGGRGTGPSTSASASRV
jgi:hypothetical protein